MLSKLLAKIVEEDVDKLVFFQTDRVNSQSQRQTFIAEKSHNMFCSATPTQNVSHVCKTDNSHFYVFQG